MTKKLYIDEIKTGLKTKGFSDFQIADELLKLENEVQVALVESLLERLDSQKKNNYEQMIKQGRSPQELLAFLNINKREIEEKIQEISQQVAQKYLSDLRIGGKNGSD